VEGDDARERLGLGYTPSSPVARVSRGMEPLMMSAHHRHWQQKHDNGWLAHVAEQPDGTFLAWAAPAGALPLGIDYVEDCLEYAQAAAEFAVRRETAHSTCTHQCEGWEEIPPVYPPQTTK
jgi:hypothetical protein